MWLSITCPVFYASGAIHGASTAEVGCVEKEESTNAMLSSGGYSGFLLFFLANRNESCCPAVQLIVGSKSRWARIQAAEAYPADLSLKHRPSERRETLREGERKRAGNGVRCKYKLVGCDAHQELCGVMRCSARHTTWGAETTRTAPIMPGSNEIKHI